MADKNDIKNTLRGVLDPAVSLLASLGVTPMMVTVAGLVVSLVGAIAVAAGLFVTGAIVLILSGLCDVLDGSLARRTNAVTTFGAFIDSTLDRITEIAYFGALIFHFAGTSTGGGVKVVLLLVALAGSFLTSYTRARAEGLGLECRVGWLERPERIALLVAGLLFGRVVLIGAIVVLAILTTVTFVQRIMHVRRVSADRDQAIQ
jgi:CDP-diacylglycerol--glycerol-3-phosphate 3-phosphatidyltransferase